MMTRTEIFVLCLLLITELVRANPILQRMTSQCPLVNYPSCQCKRSSPYEALARSMMMPANNMLPNNRMCTVPNPMARPCPKAQTSQIDRTLEQMLMDTVLTNPSLKSIVDPNSMVDVLPQNQPPPCKNPLPVVNNYIIIPTDFSQNDTDFNLDRYNIPKLVSKIKQNVAQNRRAECMPCNRRKNNYYPRCPIERNNKQRRVSYVKEKMVPRRGNLGDVYYNYESEIEYDSTEEDRDRRTVINEEDEVDVLEPENEEEMPVEKINVPKNEAVNKRIRNKTRQRLPPKNKQQIPVEPNTRKNERAKRRRYQNRKQNDISNLEAHFSEDNTDFSDSANELNLKMPSPSTNKNKQTNRRNGYQNRQQDKIGTANAQFTHYTDESPDAGDISNSTPTLEDLEMDQEEVKEPPRVINTKQDSNNRRKTKTKVTEEYLDATENTDDISDDQLNKKESEDEEMVVQEPIRQYNRISTRRRNGNRKENYTLKNEKEVVDTDFTVAGTIETEQHDKNESPTVNGPINRNRKVKSRRQGSENRRKPKMSRTKPNLDEGLEIVQNIPDSISTPQYSKKEKLTLQNPVQNSDRTKSRIRGSGKRRQESNKRTKTNRNDKVLQNSKKEVNNEENLDNINTKMITRKGDNENKIIENKPYLPANTTDSPKKFNVSNISVTSKATTTDESSLENQSSAIVSSEESLESSTDHNPINQFAIEQASVTEHPLQTSSLVEHNPTESTIIKQNLVNNSVEHSLIKQYLPDQKSLIQSIGEPTPFEESSEDKSLIEETLSEQSSLEDLSAPNSTEYEQMEVTETTLPPKIVPSRTITKKVKGNRRANIIQKPKTKSNSRIVNRSKNKSSRPTLVDKKIEDPVNSGYNLSPENRLARNSKDEAFIKEALYKYPELPEEAVRYFLSYAKNHHPNQVQLKGQRLHSDKNKNRSTHPTYPNHNHLKQRKFTQIPQEHGSKRKANVMNLNNKLDQKQKKISQEGQADNRSTPKKCLQNNLTNQHNTVVELTPTIMYIAPENSTGHQDVEDKSEKNLDEVEKTNEVIEKKSEKNSGEIEKYSKSKDTPLVEFDDSISTMNENGITDHFYPLLFESGASLTSDEFNDLRSLSSDRFHYTTDKNFDHSSIREAKMYQKMKNGNHFKKSETIKTLKDKNKFYLNNDEEKENFENTIPKPEQIVGENDLKENYYETKALKKILEDSEELEFRTPPGLEIPDFETRNIISREQYELLSRLQNEIFDDSPVYSNAKLKIDAPNEINNYTEPKKIENVKVYGHSKVVRYGFHEPDNDSTVYDENGDNGMTTERQAALIFAKSLSNPEDFW